MSNKETVRRSSTGHPTAATIKQLYGTAFRCGEPSCMKPLYRLNNDTGEWILNSRVAHIHARSEGGPRWDPQMSEEANRSADNLLPLCEEHAYEVDATPQHFPANLLREWKRNQLAEYADLRKSWPLSDAEAAEVAAESFDHHRLGKATAAANTVTSSARLVGLLIETARLQRHGAQESVQAWRAMRERVNRSARVYDANGEPLRVEPSAAESEPYRAALDNALSNAVTDLQPIATQAIAELHSVSAADQRLVPWCDWVEAAIRNTVAAAGRWPGRPPDEDDSVWPDAVDQLLRATRALTARWRGEDAPEPPEPPPPTPEPTETEQQRAYREHCELLENARPWARVAHRPYDADLCRRLMEATATAVGWPDIPSLLATGLDTTAGLAADVARNTDDETFRELIARAAVQHPLAAAAVQLQKFAVAGRKAGKPELQAEAESRAAELLRSQTWQDATLWIDNRLHARRLLDWTAHITSNEAVQDTLTAAIDHDPQLLPEVLTAMAQWTEHIAIDALDKTLGLSVQITDLPPWFPVDTFADSIRRRFPHVQPADEGESLRYAEDVERLASQVLWLASDVSSPTD